MLIAFPFLKKDIHYIYIDIDIDIYTHTHSIKL